jgi:hypothetical protein
MAPDLEGHDETRLGLEINPLCLVSLAQLGHDAQPDLSNESPIPPINVQGQALAPFQRGLYFHCQCARSECALMSTNDGQYTRFIHVTKLLGCAGVCLSLMLVPVTISAEAPVEISNLQEVHSFAVQEQELDDGLVVPEALDLESIMLSFKSMELAMSPMQPELVYQVSAEPARDAAAVPPSQPGQAVTSSWIQAMRQARTMDAAAIELTLAAKSAERDSTAQAPAQSRLTVLDRSSTGFDLRLNGRWTAFADGEPFFSFDVPEDKLDRTRLTCERKDYQEVHSMTARFGLQCRF